MDIAAWLSGLGLERYVEAFEANDIDAAALRSLNAEDLRELGVTSLGHRKKLLEAIAVLREPAGAPTAAPAEAGTAATVRDAERRQLTVLFCDLVGSTALSARLDPEDMGAVIRAYHRCCAEVVKRWGGHVAKYMGDGVLAYFGWPQAHEDEAERAVRAGLALTAAVPQLEAPAGAPLAARVGIATGLVMVGELIGEGAAKEQTVVGETPNLASRLQGRAAPGKVIISQATRRLVGGLFELTDLGPQRLKGFAAPLAAFQVVGEGRAESRFEALHGERLTPLVGREHELGILLERWAWAKDGEGQLVLLAGEPGIGKSRLIRAFREHLADEPYTSLSNYCSPHHINSALHPVIELLERAMRLDRDESPEQRLAKLEALLARSSDRLDEVVPLLAALLGIPTGDRYPALALTPEVQKRQMLQALVDQLGALAAQQPVLAVYEDVHWIDPSTLELLGLVIERIPRLPALTLITFRPEFQPPWTGQAQVTTLTMGRLGRHQGADLVARVAGAKPLPTEVVEQIVARTDGVPLFVEELTKTVLESGLLIDSGDRYELSGPLPPLAIPTTLHDSLMARLDRLAPVKEVAQIGAVIGREFSHALLAAVSPLPEDKLGDALEQLIASELVFRRGTALDAIYSFKHALVQNVAYSSLLKPRRRALHGRIAETLLRDFTDIATSAPEMLAHHYTEAGDLERASRYWRLAAERASARFANTEAIAQSRKGLAAFAGVPPRAEHVDFELDLRIGLVASLRMSDRYDEALEELQLAHKVATQHQRLLALARIHTLRGNIYFPLGQVERCFAEHQAAFDFAKQAGSTEDEARALGGLGDAYYVGGRFGTAYEHFDRCVTLCRAQGLQAIEIAYLPMRATTHMYCLRFGQALEDCGAVNDLVTSIGQARGEILSRNIGSWIYLDRHEFAQAEHDAFRGLEVVEKLGARRFVPAFNDIFARILVHKGDRAGAVELLEASWAISRETGITFFGPFVLGAMAWANSESGARREALREGQALLDRGCVSHNYFWFYRDAIEVSLVDGDWEAAETYALALDRHFRAEAAPWPAFIAARGHALAELGSRGAHEPVVARVQHLRHEAARMGMRDELAALESALESA